jgi:hypothetical protein
MSGEPKWGLATTQVDSNHKMDQHDAWYSEPITAWQRVSCSSKFSGQPVTASRHHTPSRSGAQGRLAIRLAMRSSHHIGQGPLRRHATVWCASAALRDEGAAHRLGDCGAACCCRSRCGGTRPHLVECGVPPASGSQTCRSTATGSSATRSTAIRWRPAESGAPAKLKHLGHAPVGSRPTARLRVRAASLIDR